MRPTLKDQKPSRNSEEPKSTETFTIVPVDPECFAIVTVADDGLPRTAAQVPERSIIAFRVYGDGRRAEPITIDGIDWMSFGERWAIRDPNGRVIDDRGQPHFCSRSFLTTARDEIANANRENFHTI